MRFWMLGASMVMGVSLFATDGTGQMRQRSEVPKEQTWRLEDLYPSDHAWRQAKSDLAGRLDHILQYRGTLTQSPSQLLACLKTNSDILKELGRLHSYASMKSDEDTRNATYLALKQEIQQLVTEYDTRASFIEPEVVTLDKDKLESFITAEGGLQVYRLYLFDILRSKAHTLSQEEEKILARAGQMAGGPGSIYTVFSNAEMPYPEITLSDGATVVLNKSGYALHRASPSRADREAVFQAFWSAVNR